MRKVRASVGSCGSEAVCHRSSGSQRRDFRSFNKGFGFFCAKASFNLSNSLSRAYGCKCQQNVRDGSRSLGGCFRVASSSSKRKEARDEAERRRTRCERRRGRSSY